MTDPTPVPPPGEPLPPPGSQYAPAAGQPQQQNNGMAVASLVMGILQFVCLGPIGSILAIVFGRIGINKAKRGEAGSEGMARVGFWLGIVGLILTVLLGILFAVLAILGVAFVNNAIDPANNSQTGLADGNYAMNPNTSLRINDRCSFSGIPFDLVTNSAASSSSVSVVGEGPVQCAGSGTPDVVTFDVRGGVAQITGVQ